MCEQAVFVQRKYKRLILYIKKQGEHYYAECLPFFTSTAIPATTQREAEAEAKKLLRQHLRAHLDIIG